MAITKKRLCNGTLTNNNATLYTAPANTGNFTIVKAITLCNTHTADVGVTIKLDGIPVINNHAIASYDTLVIPDLGQIIEASEIIEGFATVTDVIKYFISGKEVT